MKRAVTCLSVALALAGFLTSCGEQPAAPTPILRSQPPAQAAPLPAPSPGVAAGYTLSGVVFETVEQGVRPIEGGTISYAVDSSPNGVTEGNVRFDQDGRYVISNLPPQRPVKITAWSYAPNGFRAQQCAVNTIMRADAVLDIELVPPGPHGMTRASPTLSGVVFETTAEGRRPIAGAWVTYYGLHGVRPDVYTETDSNGRYDFCRIPLGAGRLGTTVDCFNDTVMFVPVDVRSDAVVDVDLTSGIEGCRNQR